MEQGREVPTPATVGIVIFEDAEVLDFCGPFEVLASARATGADGEPNGEALFRPLIVAERDETVRCRGGLLVRPHHTIGDHPPLDILLVPGGQGTRRELKNPVLLDWIAEQDRRAALTTSVCTGAYLLAARGLLDGRRATTHWAGIPWLRAHHPAVEVLEGVRVVDEGRIVTSAGVSAGIDMALHLVTRFHGLPAARATARDMEYAWDGVAES